VERAQTGDFRLTAKKFKERLNAAGVRLVDRTLKMQRPVVISTTLIPFIARDGRHTVKKPEKFWDNIAEKYAAKPIDDMPSYERTMERTRAYLTAESRVLELGCGTGSTALLLSADVGHITASDFSARMITIANRKAKDQNVQNVDFARATIGDGDFKPASFDAVLAFSFLHLLPDLSGVVRRAHAVLKPGGVFISKSVCLAERPLLANVALPLMRLVGAAPYVRPVSSAELEAIIAAEGFEIVEAEKIPQTGANLFIVARKP
jgi:ubiquinone/menaquinone biosynthesis C-methylase UbiE